MARQACLQGPGEFLSSLSAVIDRDLQLEQTLLLTPLTVFVTAVDENYNSFPSVLSETSWPALNHIRT